MNPSKKPNQPIKHHYLPQFYLRGFSPNQCAIFQIYKKKSLVVPGTVDSVGYLRNFHTNDIEGVKDPQFLEKSLAGLEGYQNTVLKEVQLHGIRAPETRRDLVDFLALMRMRIPAMKDHVDSSKQAVLMVQLRELERRGQLPSRPTGYEKALIAKNIVVEITNAECLRVMLKSAFDKDILKILYQMRMTLYQAPFGESFVTSDQPVALYHADLQYRHRGAGPSTMGIQVSLPLTSRLLITWYTCSGSHSELQAK